MKKISFLLVLSLFSLLLAGCANASAKVASGNANTQGGSQTGSAPEMPELLKLAVGTLKLEGTDQAVQADQAAELLPLWQAYQSVSSSSTSAAVEVQAVIDQIGEKMTPEQKQAIEAMDLSSQNMMELMQSLGLDSFRPQTTPDANQSQNSFQAPGGVMPGGAVPGGAMPGGAVIEKSGPGGGIIVEGGPGDFAPNDGKGANQDPTTMGTQQAAGGFRGGDQVNPAILQAVIKLLQSKAAGGE